MKNNPNLKFITTQKINKKLVEICEHKKISLNTLIRQTYQFLFALDYENTTKNINAVLCDIFKEYDDYEYKPLSISYKLVKTHVTKKQYEIYNKIERNKRVLYFNKLISIVINNIDYVNPNFEQTVKKDPIINKFTIKYFVNNSNNSEILMVLMESLLAKSEDVLNKNYITDAFYQGLYIKFFDKSAGQDFITQYNVAKFLQEELQKIYFCMLIIYKIRTNTKASKGNARKVYNMYYDKYTNIYNQKLELFILNEMQLYDGLSETEQIKEVFQFISALHPSEKEQTIVAMSFLPYFVIFQG